MREETERELEALDAHDYAVWRASGAGALTTLQLRGAQHAAERAGERQDARRIAAQVGNREIHGDTA